MRQGLTFARSGNEANYRTAAYEAITAFINNAPSEATPVVQTTLVTILVRMEQLLTMHVSFDFGFDDVGGNLRVSIRTRSSDPMIATTGTNSRAIYAVF